MRLDKYLAETAQCTRSEAKALLAKGRVTVNGQVVSGMGAQVEEGPDGWLRVRLDFANPEARLRWALRFGDDLEVTEPESLRQEIARRAETLLRRTKGT